MKHSTLFLCRFELLCYYVVMSNIRYHRMYELWHGVVIRCRYPSAKGYEHYGGRGISVCDRWLEPNGQGFYNFLEDMGQRPDNPEGWDKKKPYYSLDRIDRNKNYSKENCRWVRWLVQNTNKRNSLKHPGVYRNGPNWEARYRPGGKFISKTFKTKEEAIEARKQMELEYK